MFDEAHRPAAALNRKFLAMPGKWRLRLPLESAGEKFHSPLIHHSARNAESDPPLKKRIEASIEMIPAAIPASGWEMS